MNAPKLRFCEFNTAWKSFYLGEISSITKLAGFEFTKYVTYSNSGNIIALRGLNIKKGLLDLTDVKYIDESDFSKLNRSKLFKNDLLFTYVGTIGEAAIVDVDDKYYLAPNVCLIRPLQVESSEFLLEYILRDDFKRKVIDPLVTTSSQPSLSMENVRKFNLNIPTIEEQKKISNFIGVINKKIQLQQEKIDLLKEQKKGYMQKIFSQELRFKEEDGHTYPDWKLQIKAEQLFEPISNKNHNGEYPVLSATQELGMVYRDSLDRQMSFNDDNLGSYKLVEQEDFIISLRSFQGGIEFSNLQGLVSPAYTVFRKKSELVHELYFAKLFKTENFIMRLNSTTYGIRDGKAISYKDFSTLKFDVPCLEEQIKIAKFLDTFDKKIKHETAKLSQLNNQKQYFMQQMFI